MLKLVISMPPGRRRAFLRILTCAAGLTAYLLDAAPVGIFDNSGDIGVMPKPGKAEYDSDNNEYRITGGGANVWMKADAFQFVWKRVSGDITLSADIRFPEAGVMPHRKAMLMIRQSLEPDAAYADVAVHGEGLTSLQYRPAAGAMTAEIQAPAKAPISVRIERRGEKMTIYTGKPGEELQPVGPATVVLRDPVYVGLGVCSHQADVLETAIFSNVQLEASEPPVARGGGYAR
jgi:regulation of enolase protein 1 (concanavalin A-like superfamily)